MSLEFKGEVSGVYVNLGVIIREIVFKVRK